MHLQVHGLLILTKKFAPEPLGEVADMWEKNNQPKKHVRLKRKKSPFVISILQLSVSS